MASFIPRVGDKGVGRPGLQRFSTEPEQVLGQDMGLVELEVTMLGGPGYSPHKGEKATVSIHWILFSPNQADRDKPAEDGMDVFVHGVPANSEQWGQVVNMTSKYTGWAVAIDLPGMGKSSDPPRWDYTWYNDAAVIREFLLFLKESPTFPGSPDKFDVNGEDWGGGVALTFFALYPEMCVLGTVQNPISLDGYPVAEIETIGRLMFLIVAVEGGDREALVQLLGKWMEFPETLVQILKTMVVNERAWNAFSLRKIRGPYELTNYHEGGSTIELLKEGRKDNGYGPAWKPDPNLVTLDAEGYDPELAQKFKNWKALIKRASWLDPKQLMDLDYSRIDFPVNVVWGQNDNMMPASQAVWYKTILTNPKAFVIITRIPNAGHFSHIDQPGPVADSHLNFITTFHPKKTDALIRPYAGELSVVTVEFLEYFYCPSDPLDINLPLHTRNGHSSILTSESSTTTTIIAVGSEKKSNGSEKKYTAPFPSSKVVGGGRNQQKKKNLESIVKEINDSK